MRSEFLKKHKVSISILSVLFLFLIVIQFGIIPTSDSKYKKEVENASLYNNYLYTLYSNDEEFIVYHENRSTPTDLYFIVNVEPNDVGVTDRAKDKYFVYVPSACKIVGNHNTLSFKESINGSYHVLETVLNGNAQIEISCPVSSLEIVGSTYVLRSMIKEQVENEPIFIYKNGYARVDELPQEKPVCPSKTKTFTLNQNEQINDFVLDWLNEYVNCYYNDHPELESILEAIKEIVIIDNDLTQKIDGLTYSKNENTYTFQMNENFLGILLTNYYSQFDYSDQFKFLYFFNDEGNPIHSDQISEMFHHLVETYLYPNDPLTSKLIRSYVESKSINLIDFVLNGTPIYGLVKMDDFKEEIQVLDYFIEEAKKVLKVPIIINANENDLSKEFEEILNHLFEQPYYMDFISKEGTDLLLENITILPITDETYLIYDETTKYYFVAHLITTGDQDNVTLSLSIDPILETFEADEKLTMVKDTDEITITLNALTTSLDIDESEMEKVKTIVNQIDQIFSTKSINENETFGKENSSILKKDGKLTLTYSLVRVRQSHKNLT